MDMDIKTAFGSTKLTENGDLSFSSTTDNLLDILFMTEYYTKHPDEVEIGNGEKDKLFAKFIRDPRYGLGKKVLGQELLKRTGATIDEIVKCGRYDDLWKMCLNDEDKFNDICNYLYIEIQNGNELAKKWMPRFGSKDKAVASRIAKLWGLTKQQYGKLIKCETTEEMLSDHRESHIKFEQVPSLASLKYASAFARKETTKERYAKYIQDVKDGKKEFKMSVTTPYDIYRNSVRLGENVDTVFDKLEKIDINCMCVLDSSGSMFDNTGFNSSFAKAASICHYVSKCSSFMNGFVISFSSRPQLLEIGVTKPEQIHYQLCKKLPSQNTRYGKEIASMYTGDCTNTDFGAVMNLLMHVGKDDMPQYLLVASDMEMDRGSHQSKNELQRMWKEKGYTTKIIWWNFNSRYTTSMETDEMGNIFISGYNAMLLKFLEVGFDGKRFLDKLLEEYKKKIS